MNFVVAAGAYSSINVPYLFFLLSEMYEDEN